MSSRPVQPVTPTPGPPWGLLVWGSSPLWHTPAGLRSQASVLLTAAETAALALPRSVRVSCGPPAGSKRVFDGRRAIILAREREVQCRCHATLAGALMAAGS